MSDPSPAASTRLRGSGTQTLAADTWGDPGHRPVVFLHGGGQTRHAWSATARTLAATGRYAVAVDLRGHGESDWAEGGDYRLEMFARDVRAVVEALARPPVLVGASLGGLTSLLLEGEVAPGTAAALVLVDVVPQLEERGTSRILEFMTSRPDGFADLDEASEAIAAYLPHRSRTGTSDPAGTAAAGLAKVLRQRPDGRWQWHWDPAFIGNGSVSAVADVERLRACARRLAVPTLVVRGRMSDVVSLEGARQFLDDCPRAELVDVSDAGHMVAGDRNDVFTAAILAFLDRVAPAEGPDRP